MNFLDDFFKIFDLSFILYQTAAIITSAVPFWISSAEFKTITNKCYRILKLLNLFFPDLTDDSNYKVSMKNSIRQSMTEAKFLFFLEYSSECLGTGRV